MSRDNQYLAPRDVRCLFIAVWDFRSAGEFTLLKTWRYFGSHAAWVFTPEFRLWPPLQTRVLRVPCHGVAPVKSFHRRFVFHARAELNKAVEQAKKHEEKAEGLQNDVSKLR